MVVDVIFEIVGGVVSETPHIVRVPVFVIPLAPSTVKVVTPAGLAMVVVSVRDVVVPLVLQVIGLVPNVAVTHAGNADVTVKVLVILLPPALFNVIV